MFVDALIRFSGVGLLMLLAVFALRDLRSSHAAPYLVLASVTVMAAFLGSTIEPFRLPTVPHLVVRFLDIPHLVFVWLFALSIFKPAFKPGWFHVCVGVIYSLPILVVRLYQFDLIDWYPLPLIRTAQIFSIALMTHLVWSTLRGRGDDLLEKRRRARVYFVVVIVFAATAATLIEATGLRPAGMAYQTVWIMSIWPGIVWTCYWLLSASPDALVFRESEAHATRADDKDTKLLAALERVMLQDEAYRAPDLKITVLAKQMAISQHRLRSLINQTLGYQNFNSFVNTYRIAAVKTALQDKDKASLPILTIAMDCGFNSLSPFNRAFRESEQMTPSEYRRRVQNGDSP